MNFKIKLAERVFEIDSIYDEIYRMCQMYMAEKEKTDFHVTVTEANISSERKHIENSNSVTFSNAYLETLFVYRKIAEYLLDSDILLIHASVVCFGKNAYMITAPSGTGKTTFVRMLLREYMEGYVINGDKPLVHISSDGACVYGTPWAGKEQLNRNSKAELRAILILERGEENEIRAVSSLEAFPFLIKQIHHSSNGKELLKTVALLNRMTEKIPLYRMTFQYYSSITGITNEAALLFKKHLLK